MEIKIYWKTCKHGYELRYGRCPQCEKEKHEFIYNGLAKSLEPPKKIAIKRGCHSAGEPCLCNGSCQEIVGYRDPLFPGEKQS